MKKTVRKKEEKSNFTFGEIFHKSFGEYRTNFKEILKFVLIFLGIIFAVTTLFHIIALVSDAEFFNIMSTPELLIELDSGTIQVPLYYNIINSLLSLTLFLLTLFVSASLISTSLIKSKFSFKDLVKNGKSRYWEFVGFSFVVGIFILLLTLLLVIPGIIFGVFWILAAYVFFDKKEKIMPSIKESKKIVKNRWWKTFGYLLLFALISILIMMVASIVKLPTSIMTLLSLFSGSQMSLGLLITSSVLNFIYTMLYTIVLTPLSILFFKNFYLEMKKSVVKETKKKK